jgi:hypothetical protein
MKTKNPRILKKAQIEMGESIAIIFIFLILIAFGLIFYMNITKGTQAVKKEETAQLQTIETIQKISFLPELQCSGNSIIKQNCMDIFKLEAAETIIQENQIHYFDLFGNSIISINEIYPISRNWTLYNNSLEELLLQNRAELKTTYKPILLYDPIDKLYHFGMLTIGIYFKK